MSSLIVIRVLGLQPYILYFVVSENDAFVVTFFSFPFWGCHSMEILYYFSHKMDGSKRACNIVC